MPTSTGPRPTKPISMPISSALSPKQPGDRKIRHLLTIGLLASLGKESELAMHLRATSNTGVTPDEVKEVLLQVAVYAGVPAANTAIAIAKKVYAELAG